jgi:hypothetical protein
LEKLLFHVDCCGEEQGIYWLPGKVLFFIAKNVFIKPDSNMVGKE